MMQYIEFERQSRLKKVLENSDLTECTYNEPLDHGHGPSGGVGAGQPGSFSYNHIHCRSHLHWHWSQTHYRERHGFPIKSAYQYCFTAPTYNLNGRAIIIEQCNSACLTSWVVEYLSVNKSWIRLRLPCNINHFDSNLTYNSAYNSP